MANHFPKVAVATLVALPLAQLSPNDSRYHSCLYRGELQTKFCWLTCNSGHWKCNVGLFSNAAKLRKCSFQTNKQSYRYYQSRWKHVPSVVRFYVGKRKIIVIKKEQIHCYFMKLDYEEILGESCIIIILFMIWFNLVHDMIILFMICIIHCWNYFQVLFLQECHFVVPIKLNPCQIRMASQ